MKVFSEKNFVMMVQEDYLIELKLKAVIALTTEDIRLSRGLSLNYMPGYKLYSLTEEERELNPTPESRNADASKEYTKHVSALALCSDNTVLKILGNLFVSIERPAATTQLFGESNKTIDWLRSKMNVV